MILKKRKDSWHRPPSAMQVKLDYLAALVGQFSGRLEVFLNCDLDIGHGFRFSCALRPAAGKLRARHTVPFVGLAQIDAVRHGRYRTPDADRPVEKSTTTRVLSTDHRCRRSTCVLPGPS